MKKLLTSLLLLNAVCGMAQLKINIGSPDSYKLTKNPKFSTSSSATEDYFIFTRTENYMGVQTIVSTDKSGNVFSASDITMSPGSFNSSYEILNIQYVADNLLAFIENRDKTNGKNNLVTRVLRKSGQMESKETIVASFPYEKRGNAGNWFFTKTPDKKHFAIVAQLPHEKDTPDKFNFYFFDENMKQLNTGQFSFDGFTKEMKVAKFYASDKGEFYLMTQEYEKGFEQPILYKGTLDSPKGTIIPVNLPDPAFRNFRFITSMSAEGNVLMGGYTTKKSTFSMGEPAATGMWMFTSAKPTEVKTYDFEKPITNMTAVAVLASGNTTYLVGEQYKSEVKMVTTQRMGSSSFESEYTYRHNDILVTAFDEEGNKKFEIPLNRKWGPINTDAPYGIAAFVLNDKLTLLYNDQFGKYVPNRTYDQYPLPVMVSITNDGLMEPLINYAKEADVQNTGYTMYPMYGFGDKDHIVILAGNGNQLKGYGFK